MTDAPSAAAARRAAVGRVARHPGLRRALIAYLVFASVEMAAWVAVLVYAMAEGNAFTVAIVAVVQLVPAALLAPVQAAWLDRLPRRAVLPVAYGIVAVLLGVTAVGVLVGWPLPFVVGLSMLATVVIAMGRPAHFSIVPRLVDRPADLVAANVVTTMGDAVGNLIGPGLAGVVMAVASPGAALAVSAAAMGATALAVVTLKVPGDGVPGSSSDDDGGTDEASSGVSRSGMAIVIGAASGIIAGATDVLIVVLAIDILLIGDAGAGYLGAAWGVGALLGSLVAVSLVGKQRLGPSVLLGAAVAAIAMGLIAVVPAAAALIALLGIGAAVVDVATRTLLQRRTAMAEMGAAFGRLEGAQLAGIAAGSLASPFVIDWVGGEAAFAVFGAFFFLVVVAQWPGLRRADDDVEIPRQALEALRRIGMFAGLRPSALETLARGAVILTVPDGGAIVTQGDSGSDMYVVESGAVVVTQDGAELTTLGPSELFGEIALLMDVPRTATVTASEPTTVVQLSRQAVMAALAHDRHSRRALGRLAAARMERDQQAP